MSSLRLQRLISIFPRDKQLEEGVTPPAVCLVVHYRWLSGCRCAFGFATFALPSNCCSTTYWLAADRSKNKKTTERMSFKNQTFFGTIWFHFVLEMSPGIENYLFTESRSLMVSAKQSVHNFNFDRFYLLFTINNRNVSSRTSQQPGRSKLHIVKIPTQHQWVGPLLSCGELLCIPTYLLDSKAIFWSKSIICY